MHLKNLRRSRESKLNPSAAKLQRIAAFETWLAKRPVVAGPQLFDRPALHREFMALRKREQNLAAGARLRARLRGEQLPPVGPSPPPFAQVAAQPAPPIALPPPEHWSPERGEAPDSTAEYGPVSDDGAEGSAAAAATAMGVAPPPPPPSPPPTLHPPAPQPATSMLPPIVLCGPMRQPRETTPAAVAWDAAGSTGAMEIVDSAGFMARFLAFRQARSRHLLAPSAPSGTAPASERAAAAYCHACTHHAACIRHTAPLAEILHPPACSMSNSCWRCCRARRPRPSRGG